MSAESRQRALARICREQRDQAFETQAKQFPDMYEMKRVLSKCAVLLGVIALLLDPEPEPPAASIALTQAPAVTYYRRIGKRFVKVVP